MRDITDITTIRIKNKWIQVVVAASCSTSQGPIQQKTFYFCWDNCVETDNNLKVHIIQNTNFSAQQCQNQTFFKLRLFRGLSATRKIITVIVFSHISTSKQMNYVFKIWQTLSEWFILFLYRQKKTKKKQHNTAASVWILSSKPEKQP